MIKPPFTLTSKIFNLSTDITNILGKYEGLALSTPKPELRKQYNIESIHSSLAIEGNTLTLDKVTDIINNKRVIGPKKDILEVQNALKVYESLSDFSFTEISALLNAHSILMKGLKDDAGKFRTKNVGVMAGKKVVHMAPKHTLVPQLVHNLFDFLNSEKELHPLIKSSVFHYEFEFIHPFSDGNGRMGRLWQSLILIDYNTSFNYIPIESVIKRHQQGYYGALAASTSKGESTIFIEFMLNVIKEALDVFSKKNKPQNQGALVRIEYAKEIFHKKKFSRKEYMHIHQGISTATASRDLSFAVVNKLIKREGERVLARYSF